MRHLVLLLAISLTVTLHAQVVARTIGFDPPHLISKGHGASFRPGYREQGFYLSVAEGNGTFTVQSPLYPFSPDNGSCYARFIQGAENLSMVHEQGLAFTPVSVDLARYNELSPASIVVQGVKAGGEVVSTSFGPVTLGDGNGPGEDFQKYTFPASFADITQLKIPGTSYTMDNLEVIPSVDEEALTPALPSPYVYDITWDDSPHQVGQITASGGQRAPSSAVFGVPYVRDGIGAMPGHALELSQAEAGYDQIEMALALRAQRYVIDFDLCQPRGGAVTLFLDTTHGFLSMDLAGSIAYFNGSSGAIIGNPPLGSTYTAPAVTHFQVDWDRGNGTIKLSVNGAVKASWAIPQGSSLDLNDVRFSTGTPSVTGLDNVKIQAMGQPAYYTLPGSFDFQSTPVGQTKTTPVHLINPSANSILITEAEVSGPSFTFSGLTFPLVLPARSSVSGTLSGKPSSTGYQRGAVSFQSASGNAVSHLVIDGTAYNLTGYFSVQPSSRWVTLASPLTITSNFHGNVTRFEWTKDNVVIPGTSSTNTITNGANIQHAGVYRVKAYMTNGTIVTSDPAHVGVISPWTRNETLNAGGTTQFSVLAAGPGLSYLWRQNESSLPGSLPGVAVIGSRLTLSPIQFEHEGVFTLDAFLPNGAGGTPLTFRAVTYNLTVPQPPRITTTSLGHAMVEQPYQMSLASISSTPVDSYQATGLPLGMVISAETGVVSGTPLPSSVPTGTSPDSPVLYSVQVSAENQHGRSAEVTLPLWVHPPHRGARFLGLTGMISPPTVGGRWQAVVTGGGQVTAQIEVGTRTIRAAGELSLDPQSGEMTGNLRSESLGRSWELRLRQGRLLEYAFNGGLVPALQAGLCIDFLTPALHPAGLYPTALSVNTTLESPGLDTPIGTGILMARLGAGARMSCVGLLPDGSTITSSGELVADWEDEDLVRYPLSSRTNAGTGWVTGWLITGRGLMDGRLAWYRDEAVRESSYPSGFSLDSESNHLQAIGSLHSARSIGTTLLNLQTQTQRLFATHWKGDYSRLFSIDSRFKAIPLAPATPRASLSFTPSDGTFAGTLEVGSYRAKPLMGKFRGLLVPRLGKGVGFLLRPDMALYEENLRKGRASLLLPFDSASIELTPELAD